MRAELLLLVTSAALTWEQGLCVRTLHLQDVAGQEPSPDEFLAQFDSVELAHQPYSSRMLQEGFLGMTDEQKVWMSHYWEGLFEEAVERVRSAKECGGRDVAALLSAVQAVPKLSQVVLFSQAEWEQRFLTKLRAAVALIPQDSMPQEVALKTMLQRLEDRFPKDMSNPRKDFYLGMTDQSVFRFANGSADVPAPLDSVLFMHSLNTEESRTKSDSRSEAFARFFKEMYDLGLAKAPWNLEAALKEHADEQTREAISSVTPLLSFELRADEKYGPGFVVMEGNGRVAAMNVALDKVRLDHADFVAPSILLHNYEFGGSDVARRNRNFFLDLNFRNQFPNVDVPGWAAKVQQSVRKVDDALVELVRSRPRYFGMMPLRSGLYEGP